MENENAVAIPEAPKSGRKVIKVIAVFALAAIVLFGWIASDYVIPKSVTVVVETMENTNEISAEVRAHTVSDVLDAVGVPVSEIDQILPFLDKRAEDGMTIHVTKRLETTATIAGEKQRFILSPGTIEENLEFNNIEYDSDDIVSPKLTKNASITTKLVLKDIRKVVAKKEVDVPSGSRIILDPTLASGVLSEVPGIDGKALYTVTTTYVIGKKDDTKEVFKKWITEPQDHTIRLGTAATGHSGEVSIIRSFTSNTTAYYAGKKARGATGQRCYYGTCAVDPKVIPYGSRLWVQGYGFAYANDCGGAIKGTKLDLYMRSTKECYRWGRRWVTAYLLG